MKTSPGGPGVRIVHTRCAVCTHTGYLWLWGAYLAHIHDLFFSGVRYLRTTKSVTLFFIL